MYAGAKQQLLLKSPHRHNKGQAQKIGRNIIGNILKILRELLWGVQVLCRKCHRDKRNLTGMLYADYRKPNRSDNLVAKKATERYTREGSEGAGNK